MSFDPYQILGVESAANADEIRRAYRALARRYHPDVNKNARAEERFKLLAQAYSVLSDARRRALFDEFGEDSLTLGFDARKARARGRAGDRPARSSDPGARRSRASSEAVNAAGHGGGSVDEGARRTRRARATLDEEELPDLHGKLEVDLATAIRGGEVKVPSPGGAVLAVQLPAGVESGHQVRLKGRGRPGRRGGLPGDLYLDVEVQPHPFFHRQGRDLVLELPITIEEAHRGAQVEVPTLEGWVRVPVPAGSRGGEKLRLRGKGLHGRDGRGDLYVHLCIRLPDRLEAAGRSLERLTGLYSGDVRAGLRL